MDIEEVIIKTEPTEIEGNVEEVEDVEISVVNTVVPVAATARKVPAYALVYVCNICNKVFGDKSLYEHHVTIVHRPLTVNILNGAFCNKCKKILDENVYDAHLPQCLSNFTCLPMSMGTPYTKQFECSICNKAMINLNRLSEHLRTVHRPITINYVDKSTHSFCDTCKNLFKDDLLTHFPCNAVDVKCFFCLTKMPLKNHFLTHNLLSQGFRKFQCSLCTIDTKLMNFTELNEHMKHHNKLGIFKCVKCKLHMDQSDLERHYELYHLGCKCVTDPCTCDKYNESFYIKNILKIDIPVENVKSSADTQNKSIQTCTTFKIPKIKISCKNCGPSKLPENVSAAEKEIKSKITSQPGLSNSLESKTTSCLPMENQTKNSSTTSETENSTIELDDKPAATIEELLQKDKIDKESFLRSYFHTYVKNKNLVPQKIQLKKRLSKRQLKKYRWLVMKQGQMRAKEKYKKTNAQLKLLKNTKTANNEQNSTVVKEQDEMMCSDIIKEEQTEYMDTGNIKIELDHLLQDIRAENSQQPVNIKEKLVPLILTSSSKEFQNKENGNKKLKIQSNDENIKFQTTNNSVKAVSSELNNEQPEDSRDSSDANSSAHVDQQEDVNSEADEEMFKVHLVNIDRDKNEITRKDIPSSKNEPKTSDKIDKSIQITSEDQTSPKNNQFQESPDNLEPEFLPNVKNNSALELTESNNRETCQECSICGLKFPNVNLLNNHLMQTHQLDAEYIKKYITKSVYCAFCETYTSQNHFYQCRGKIITGTCYFCNMHLPKRNHFELHNIEFITYNKMCCTLCNDKTEYKIKSLNEHRIKVHNDVGVFECVICKDKFSSNMNLKRHLVHSKHKFDRKNSAKNYRLLRNHCKPLKYFKCKACEKIFFSHTSLTNHRCKEFDLCFICGQTFTKSSYYLRDHLNKHLKTESYDCKICDKKFTCRKHMIQHQKIHEKKKKFNCLECPQTFTQQTSLIYHMATHTKENVFKCSVCDILFDKQSKLTAHMQIHNENGTNPYKCEVCNKFFSHKCNLLVHKRTHRENNTT